MAIDARETGNLYVVADAQRRRLYARDAQLLQQLTESYGRIYSDLRVRLDLLIREALDAEVRTSAQLWRLQRTRDLLEQLQDRLSVYEAYAAETITSAQAAAVQAAIADADRLLRQAAVSANLRAVFNRVPVEALDFLIGTLGDGTPLREYFAQQGFAQETIKRIRNTLADGIVQGWAPEKIAREFRQSLGTELTRALTIARTETLRSYREASRANYAANGIAEWEWIATLSTRTCAACIALDGQRFPIDEPLNDHPNGRCTMVPVLPFDIPRVRRTEFGPFEGTGSEWFTQLPPSVQRQMLGPRKHDAFLDGQIRLEDLIAQSMSPTFGSHFHEASLISVMGG